MTRSLVGIAAAAIVALAPTVMSAQSAEDPRVTVMRADGKVTIAAKAGTLLVTETLTATAFDLKVVDGLDAVRFSGDAQGRLLVERGSRAVRVSMAAARPADLTAVRSVMAQSLALERFNQLMASSWAHTAKSATPFASAHALVRVLQADTEPTGLIVSRVAASAAPRIRTVGQASNSPMGCWDPYQRDVLTYTYELEACLVEARGSLNPFRNAWCAYEYNLKSTLAFFWLLDCSGLPW